jgi:hypothetical protein
VEVAISQTSIEFPITDPLAAPYIAQIKSKELRDMLCSKRVKTVPAGWLSASFEIDFEVPNLFTGVCDLPAFTSHEEGLQRLPPLSGYV